MTEFCRDIRENLPLFLLGELDPREFAAIDEHLETCVACGAELNEIRAVFAALPAKNSQVIPSHVESSTPHLSLPLESPGVSLQQTPGGQRHNTRTTTLRRVSILVLVFLTGVIAGWSLNSDRSPHSNSAQPTPVSSEIPQGPAADRKTNPGSASVAQLTPERLFRGLSAENGLARVLLVMSAVARESE